LDNPGCGDDVGDGDAVHLASFHFVEEAAASERFEFQFAPQIFERFQ
jgi:hypothetical protein